MPKHSALFTAASVLALLPAVWQTAQAGDLTVSNNRTTSASTSQGDGSGPGNITVDSNGKIDVTSGAAVTIDSNNAVDNEGTISSTKDASAIGVHVTTASGNLTGSITNNGTLSALTSSKTTTGTGPNYGILVDGSGTFSGNIVNATGTTGTIEGHGENSFGIRIQSDMIGNITNNATIQVFDKNSIAIRLDGHLTGNINNAGTLNASVEGGTGLFIGGPVTGMVSNNGSITSGVAPTTNTSGNQVAQLNGGPGLYVGASVSNGILNNGNGLTSDEEATITAEINAGQNVDNFTPDARISVQGSANAIHIEPLTGGSQPVANVDIGAVTTSDYHYGLVNIGAIASISSSAGTNALTFRINGLQQSGSTYTTTLENGLYNGRGASITASATDANAQAIQIGDYAIVPTIQNTSTISATTFQSTDVNGNTGAGGSALGIEITGHGELDSINNSGDITASAAGSSTNATAIIDRSGTITSVVNSGTISAFVNSGNTGHAVALDLSAAANPITLTNSGVINGDVYLGAGSDTLDLTGGSVNGAINMGAGANVLNISNASFSGSFVSPSGTVDLNAVNATVALSNSAGSSVRNASFDGNSTLKLTVFGATNLQGALVGSNTVSFQDGTRFAVAFDSLLLGDQTDIPVVEANTITFQSDVSGLDLSSNPALYVPTLTYGSSSGTDTIYVSLRRKTAAELGLNANETAIYLPAIEGLAGDQTLGAAFANLGTTADIRATLDQLLPDLTGSLQYAAVASQDMTLGAIDRRLSSLRQVNVIQSLPQNQRVFIRDRGFSPWVQEFVNVAHQDADPTSAGYHGFNWGGAFGADYPFFGLDALGLSFSEVYSEFSERNSGDNPMTNFSSQVSLYATKSFGGLFADVVGTYAFNSGSNVRNITIGDQTRSPHASWSGQQYSGKVQVGYRAQIGILGISARGHLDYLKLKNGAYDEKEGDGADLAINKSSWTSERAGGDATIQATFNVEGWSIVTPEIRGGWSKDLKNNPFVISGKFVNGTDTFTLTGPQRNADSYYGGAGMTFVADWGVIAIDYDRQWNTGFVSNSFGATIRWWF